MLTDSARILARRWSWAVASLILALVLGTAAYIAVPPSQVSNATVLFVPPSTQPGVVGKTNPFYSLGGSTLVMTTVVEVLVTDDKTSTRLAQAGYRAKYEVTPNLALNSGPSLLVKVDDKSAVMVQNTMTAVLGELRDQLKTVQTEQGVTAKLLISSVVLTQSTHPSADHKEQIQTGAIVAVCAVFLLFTLILLLERRRIAKRRAPPDESFDLDPPTIGPLHETDPTADSSFAGPRSGSHQAHRKARVSLATRTKLARANRPSSYGRQSP